MKIINAISNTLKKVGRSLVKNSREPQIKQKQDKHGNKYWQAYDLNTNTYHTFSSEEDVKVWIEHRYHYF